MTRRLIIAPVLVVVPLLFGCEGQGATSIGAKTRPTTAPLETTAPSVALPASSAAPDKDPTISSSEKGTSLKANVRHYDPDQKKEIVGSSTDVIGDTGKKKGSDYMQGDSEVQISDQPVRRDRPAPSMSP